MLSKTAEYALRTVACLAGEAGRSERRIRCVSRQRYRGVICTKCFRTSYMLSWCTHGPDQGVAIRFLVPLMTSPFWTLLTRWRPWSEFDTVRWVFRRTRVSVRFINNLTRPTLLRRRRLPALR